MQKVVRYCHVGAVPVKMANWQQNFRTAHRISCTDWSTALRYQPGYSYQPHVKHIDTLTRVVKGTANVSWYPCNRRSCLLMLCWCTNQSSALMAVHS